MVGLANNLRNICNFKTILSVLTLRWNWISYFRKLKTLFSQKLNVGHKIWKFNFKVRMGQAVAVCRIIVLIPDYSALSARSIEMKYQIDWSIKLLFISTFEVFKKLKFTSYSIRFSWRTIQTKKKIQLLTKRNRHVRCIECEKRKQKKFHCSLHWA